MTYDINQLRNLRDTIDTYLAKGNEDEQRIYDALEKSIAKAVAEGMKPVLDEFVKQLKESH
jgi:hypothetical protein